MESPSLMILNDDCLLHLLEYFSLSELIEIRGVCSRLDALIDKFRHRYANFDFRVFHHRCSLDLVRKTLSYLGPIIKSIRITDGGSVGSTWIGSGLIVFAWIGIFCPNLESFVLESFGWFLGMFDGNNLLPFMSNLREFTLLRGVVYNFKQCFELATNLEGLTIVDGLLDETVIEILRKVSHLKYLKLVDFDYDFKPIHLRRTLENNLTLKVLNLSMSRCPMLNKTSVKYIVKNLTELEELSFVAFDKFEIIPFGDLPKLKKLTVELADCSGFDSLLEKLAEKNIIEELHILPSSDFDHDSIVNIDFEWIGKLTNLKALSVIQFEKLTNSDFKHLQNLTKLEKLSVKNSFDASPNGLLELVRINQKLKWLDVRYADLDYDFLEKLIRVLKQSSDRQKFVINVRDTEIYEDTEKLQETLEGNSKLIKVLFLDEYDKDNYLLPYDLK